VTPLSVFSPEGTKYYLKKNYGDLGVYKQESENNTDDLASRLNVENNENKENLVQVNYNHTITPDIMGGVAAEKLIRKGHYPSQNQVKKCSASNLPDNVEGKPLQWLHLVGHQFKGNSGQVAENLVGGTQRANLDMLYVAENPLAKIVRSQEQSVVVNVTAKMKPDSQIAETMHYAITQPAGQPVANFVFNAGTEGKTPKNTSRYASKLLKKRLSIPLLSERVEQVGCLC